MGTALQTFLEKVASGGTAWKNACRVVATEAITLQGLQTIASAGVTVEEGDRVLYAVAGRTAGIYVASVNAWTRAEDMARDSYVKSGTTVRVTEGVGAGTWTLTTTGTVRIGTTALAFAMSSGAPGGMVGLATTNLPDSNATISLTARRQVIASGTLTAARTYEIPDGTTDGEVVSIDRDDASHHRVYMVNADGTSAGYADHVGRHHFEWKAATGWRPLAMKSADRSFRLEHFATGVGPIGAGDAEADTSALEAFFDAFEDYDTPTNQDLVFELVIPARFSLNRSVYVKRTDYATCRIRGIAAGNGGGMGPGFTWAGATAWSVSGVNMAFDRTARTIVRASGSWVTTGAAAGQSVLVTNPTAVSTLNVRLFDSIASVGGTGNNTLTITAPEATYPTVGFDTEGMKPYTEAATAGYVVTRHLPMLVLEGASGVELLDLSFDCDDKATHGIHVDIRPDRPNATNMRDVRIIGCAVYSPLDNWNSAAIGIGRPPSNPAVGSDINNVEIVRPVLQATASGNQGCGIRFWDGNNTKIHHISRPQIWYFRRGIDHESASENISVVTPHFESCEIAIYNNGYLRVSDAEAERCGSAIYGGRGRCVEINNSWNLSTDSTLVAVKQQVHEAIGCTYVNTRVYLTVSSINTGTNVLTASNGSERTPADGDEVVLRSGGGRETIPGGASPEVAYWLGDVTSLGGGVYTFTLRTSSGCPTLDIPSSGSSVYVLTQSKFASGDLSRPSADSSRETLTNCHIWAADEIPYLCGSGTTTNAIDPAYTYGGSNYIDAVVDGCFGTGPGYTRRLRPLRTAPMGYQGIVPEITYYPADRNRVIRGVNTRGWNAEQYKYTIIKNGTFSAGSTLVSYIDIPFRCGIRDAMFEIVTPFAGGTLTNATAKLGYVDVGHGLADDDAYILSTVCFGALAGIQKRAGFSNASRGVDLQMGTTHWPLVAGATDWGWSARWALQLTIVLTGEVFANLTAGELILHYCLEQVPPIGRT